jgi:hypothetical protein
MNVLSPEWQQLYRSILMNSLYKLSAHWTHSSIVILCMCQWSDYLPQRLHQRSLRKPISLAYSLKHLLHTISPYFRMTPWWLEQTRLQECDNTNHYISNKKKNYTSQPNDYAHVSSAWNSHGTRHQAVTFLDMSITSCEISATSQSTMCICPMRWDSLAYRFHYT